MADFSIIADISDLLIKKLRENMCPEPMQSPEAIQLAAPSEKNVDFQLGLFLYDMKEFSEYRSSGMVREKRTQTPPPKPLTLHFMLFLNNKAQLAAGAQAEMRILARAMQYLFDNPYLSMSDAHNFEEEPDPEAAITFLNMSFEEKMRVWQALNVPYQVATYFTVAPVLISSRIKQSIVRVTEFDARIKTLHGGD